MFPFTPDLRTRLHEALAGFPHAPALQPELALKHAAVAITIVETAAGSGEAGFLLTRRAKTLRGHAGQWALPGGRCDPGETPAEAALRELHEELGLHLAATDVLGMLDDYPTRSGYCITPVIVWCADAAAIAPNPTEVASVHRIPLAEVAHPEAVSFVSIVESERRVVRIRIAGDLVHAPTAAVLYQFGELLVGRHTRVADLEQPVFAWR
jgi:8-oxo-dGTP pyrophosphatase MutT (NUDIX family)